MLPDDVRGMAHQVDLTVEDLYNMPGSIRSLATSLQSNWQGGKAARYADKLRQLAGRLHGETINLQRLARQVRNEVDQWEEADNSHDFKIAHPSYSISTGEGIQDPLSTGLKNIRNIIKTIKIADNAIDIITDSHILPPWFSVVGGVALFADLYHEDWDRYKTYDERAAALVVDAVFAFLITAVKEAAKHGGIALIKASVGTLLTGAGAPLALVQALIGFGLWIGSEFAESWAVEAFRDSSIKDSLIRSLAESSSGNKITGTF
jgi:uncharacterized protein YukE